MFHTSFSVYFLAVSILITEVYLYRGPTRRYYHHTEAEDLFVDFVKKFRRTFETEGDRRRRFNVFRSNLERINTLNNRSKTAVFGITPHADQTLGDISIKRKACLRNVPKKSGRRDAFNMTFSFSELGPVPDVFDWSKKGAVTEPRQQGPCAACWAFACASAVETQHFMKHNHLYELSAQQLLNCSPYKHNCNGGTPHRAFEAAAKFGGLVLDKDYPYVGGKSRCWANRKRIVAKVTGSEIIDTTNEDLLTKVIYHKGPVVVGIQEGMEFHLYRGGLARGHQLGCGSDRDISHAVLIVGYGYSGTTPHWIIKNSYGTEWGEQGYLTLIRNTNACKVMEYIVLPHVV